MAEEHFFATLATIQVDGDGNLRQKFHQLKQLNSFSMRKTVWHDKCQGEVNCLYIRQIVMGVKFSFEHGSFFLFVY